jgi:hypothetical protein
MSAPEDRIADAPRDEIPNCLSLMSLWPLFAGIGRRPVLLAVVAVVSLVAWGLLGRYYGLPDLFWNERWLVQGLAGFGAALLLGQVCFVSYLLDGEAPALKDQPQPAPARGLRALKCRLVHRLMAWLVPSPPSSEDATDWPKLRWYLSVTWLPLLVPTAATTSPTASSSAASTSATTAPLSGASAPGGASCWAWRSAGRCSSA